MKNQYRFEILHRNNFLIRLFRLKILHILQSKHFQYDVIKNLFNIIKIHLIGKFCYWKIDIHVGGNLLIVFELFSGNK
jgi:hypothetical protein